MKKMLFVAVILMLAVGHAYADNNIKVGVVDIMKALNESDAGKKAKTELEAAIKAKQTVIDEKGKAIEKMKGDLEKQSSVLSAEARKSKEDELEKMIREYQRTVSDSQSEVKKQESELTNGILQEIRAIVEKIGKNEGYTMIIENAEGIILYSKKDLDLTDAVIKKYNESKKAGK
jgi:outer membrane protein